MKRTLLYIVSLMLFTACANETSLLTEEENTVQEEQGSSATIFPMKNQDGPHTRSALVFTPNGMNFIWHVNDKASVFPYSDGSKTFASNESQKISFTVAHLVVKDEGELTESSTGFFKSFDKNIKPIENYTYLSCSPVTDSEDYACVPVRYTGQTQASNVKIALEKTNSEKYEESEIAASAHLADYNYMVDEKPVNNKDGMAEIHFQYFHMDATVRFFLAVPDAEGNSDFTGKSAPSLTYDEIQLISTEPGKEFVTEATMNLPEAVSNPDFNAEGKQTSNVMSLKLGDGFKLGNDNLYKEKYYVIIAYMQLAEIDLSNTSYKPLLYLIAHDSSDNKYYFKAELANKNIKVRDEQDPQYGCSYQWSTNNYDLPILFNMVNVQKWTEDTGYSNGEEGTGTGSW